jgi:hypothetical protein
MAREFPTFPGHETALCHRCRGPLKNRRESGMALRQGHWKADCARCGVATFYDLPPMPYEPPEMSDGYPVNALQVECDCGGRKANGLHDIDCALQSEREG